MKKYIAVDRTLHVCMCGRTSLHANTFHTVQCSLAEHALIHINDVL